jgi:hypothetical protein
VRRANRRTADEGGPGGNRSCPGGSSRQRDDGTRLLPSLGYRRSFRSSGPECFLGSIPDGVHRLSVVLLVVGLIQMLRLRRSCRRQSRAQMALGVIGAAVVIAVVLFPEWVGGILADLH